MRLTALQVSDLHLGSGKNIPGNFQRQIEVLENVLVIAEEYKVDCILVPGDLFDKSTVTREEEDTLLKFFLLHNHEFLIIRGNHDFLKTGKDQLSFLSIIAKRVPGIRIALRKPRVVTFQGYKIHLIPFFHDKAIYEQIEVEKNSIVLFHDTVIGAKFENCYVPEKGIDFKMDWDRIIYLALGHVHKWQVIKENRASYSGSPYQVDFGEDAAKFVNIIKFEGNDVVEFKQVPVPSQKLLVKEVRTKADLDAVTADTGNKYKINLHDAKLGSALPANVATFNFADVAVDPSSFAFSDNIVADFQSWSEKVKGVSDQALMKRATEKLGDLLKQRSRT